VNKRVTGVSVLIVVLVAGLGYYEFNSYEGAVVSTVVTTGKITNVQASGAGGGGVQAPVAGAAGAGGKAAATTSSGGISFVTIQVGSNSFTQILSCGTLPYYSGMSVKVADQTLRSGSHNYVPDVACKGSPTPFSLLHLPQSTSTVT